MKLSAIGTLTSALAVVLALLLAAPASAASLDGSGPQAAIPLTGTVTGTLAPGQSIWYNYFHDANINDAITLKSNPGIGMLPFMSTDNTGYTGGVFFNVEWQGSPLDANFPGGMFEQDVPGYFRVGQSTQSLLKDGTALPDGTQYWQQGKSINSIPLALEVRNLTSAPASYALTLSQSNDAISADDNAVTAPAAPLLAVPSAPTAVAGVSTTGTTGGAGPAQAQSATPLMLNGSNSVARNGTVTGTLAPGQSIWYSYYHDASLNDAITLKSNPGIGMLPFMSTDNTGYTGGVFFNVEWQGSPLDANFPGGMFEQDLPGYFRVGQSTQSLLKDGAALPDGTQYWQQGKSIYSNTFDLVVVNQSSVPVTYALTLTQSNDAISADNNAITAPLP